MKKDILEISFTVQPAKDSKNYGAALLLAINGGSPDGNYILLKNVTVK